MTHRLTALLLLPFLTGCIDRTETITVDASGGIEFVVEHETKQYNEMYLGDPVPTVDRGWIVETWKTTDDQDEEVFHLKAIADYPPDAKLPVNYASLQDPDPEAALQFPTTLVIEQRPDGWYYHFRRTYRARPWAHLEMQRAALEETVKDIKDKSWEEMAEGERVMFIEAIVRFELRKMEWFARAAFDDVAPDEPQDRWLHLYMALRSLADSQDFMALAELVTQQTLGEIEEDVLEARAEAFEEEVRKTLEQALREQPAFGAAKLNEFIRRYDFHKRYHEITEDLGDDDFNVTVEMPGEIVAHNAESATDGSATWRFPGVMFRDTDFEVMVTSRVP